MTGTRLNGLVLAFSLFSPTIALCSTIEQQADSSDARLASLFSKDRQKKAKALAALREESNLKASDVEVITRAYLVDEWHDDATWSLELLTRLGARGREALPRLAGLRPIGSEQKLRLLSAMCAIDCDAAETKRFLIKSITSSIEKEALGAIGLTRYLTNREDIARLFAKRIPLEARPQTKLELIRALGWAGPQAEPFVGVLHRHLHDKDALFREAAALTLARAGPKGINSLLDVLRSTPSADSNSVIYALGHARVTLPGLINQLLVSLDGGNAKLRALSAEALGNLEIRQPEVVSSLARHLKTDSDWHVRREVAEALGRIGTDNVEVREALRDALCDENAMVRRFSEISLWRLGGAKFRDRGMPQEPHAYLTGDDLLLFDTIAYLRDKFAERYRKIGESEAIEECVQAISSMPWIQQAKVFRIRRPNRADAFVELKAESGRSQQLHFSPLGVSWWEKRGHIAKSAYDAYFSAAAPNLALSAAEKILQDEPSVMEGSIRRGEEKIDVRWFGWPYPYSVRTRLDLSYGAANS